MFDPYIILYWYRRLVLLPIGLTSPVDLVHSAGNCIVGDGDSRKSLLEVLKASCPSLIGIRAWYSGSFWLFNSSHFHVCVLIRFNGWNRTYFVPYGFRRPATVL